MRTDASKTGREGPAEDRTAPRSRAGLTVVDLFCGAGGISEGFRQAGCSILAGLDSDPDAIATFSRNFPEAQAVYGDIRANDVRTQIAHVLQSADILVGGPPCQAFSQVRNHSRVIDDPRNRLYREFVASLRVALPVAFAMENVTGIDQMGVREQITSDLTLGGLYQVTSQVLDAADFGVPQTRKRLLFLGTRTDLRATIKPLSGTRATEVISLERRINDHGSRYRLVVHNCRGRELFGELNDRDASGVVTAADAISDLERLPVGNRQDALPYESLSPPQSAYQREMRAGAGPVIFNVQVPRINADTVARLRAIPKGGNHRDLPSELLERYITGQRWGQDNGTGRLSRRHFYAYRRLHPSIWAWTLNTKGDSVYHYKYPRSLSVREFARLQSFPDRFVFTTNPRRGKMAGRHDGGPAHSRYRQVGNAVPPLLAVAAAKALMEAVGDHVPTAGKRKARAK